MSTTLKDIEVFKVGKHTDSAGNTSDWTLQDLQDIADKYNNQSEAERHLAPAVIGHPVDNSPAYGWVEKLKVVGDKLLADFYDVMEDFKTALDEGRYKTRSIALYEGNLLKHIGWLGGVPPAVKGLAEPKFAQFATGKVFRVFNEPTPAADPKIDQQARAAKWGISILGENLTSVTKPAAYANITDEQFADPVNYRFPLHDTANLKASYSLWNSWDVRDKYSETERHAILARIIAAIEGFGLTKDDLYGWGMYSESSANPRAERSTKYRISILEGKGHDTKPAAYASLNEEDFADPVNYRFPLTETYMPGVLGSWSRQEVQDGYSEKDRQIISARLIIAARTLGIDLTPHAWAQSGEYIDMPVDELTKKQLENIVTRLGNRQPENSDSTINKPKFEEDVRMNKAELLALMSEVSAWLSQKFGDDTGNQFLAEVTRRIEEKMPGDDTAGGTPPVPGTQASEHKEDPKYAALQKQLSDQAKKINDLVAINKLGEHNQFIERMIKDEERLKPHQRNLALSVLMMGEKQTSVAFSEGDQVLQITGENLVQRFIQSFPPQKMFTEQTSGHRVSTVEGDVVVGEEFAENDEERIKLHNRIVKYQEAEAAKGRSISYAQALQYVTREG